MRGNEHVKRAEDLTQSYGTMSDLGLAASRAQVYATLAVAEEQRLANLIAFQSLQVTSLGQMQQAIENMVDGLDEDDRSATARVGEALEKIAEAVEDATGVIRKIDAEIRERLGLA